MKSTITSQNTPKFDRLVADIAKEMSAEECGGPKPLMEGIDIDDVNLIVSYNPSHEKNVDTSLDGNPTVDNTLIDGVPVWSIFKRNRESNEADGNPLAYALKNEKGWHFRSSKDKAAIVAQFNSIAEKFLQSHSYNVTVIAPSSNPLNQAILDTVVRLAPNIQVITDLVFKLSTDDVEDMVMEPNSKFRQTFPDPENFRWALSNLRKYLRKMNETRNRMFTRHLVGNQAIRNALDTTLKLSDDICAEDANKINGSDVLIIDDVVSRGQTVLEMVNIIKTAYAPKSLTVLTLLSKCY